MGNVKPTENVFENLDKDNVVNGKMSFSLKNVKRESCMKNICLAFSKLILVLFIAIERMFTRINSVVTHFRTVSLIFRFSILISITVTIDCVLELQPGRRN